MINELYQASAALRETGISTEKWHARYNPIANISENVPCVRIVLDGASVSKMESVLEEKGKNIRRYGDNQGSFPAMNLAALFRISDEAEQKEISRLIQNMGKGLDLEKIKRWCHSNNWSANFCNKYRLSFRARSEELAELLQGDCAFEPLSELIRAAQPFQEPEALHRAMEIAAMEMLKNRENTALALRILFFLPSGKEKENKNNAGKLSVVLDSYALEDQGMSTIGSRFARKLNTALLRADSHSTNRQQTKAVDAFGSVFAPFSEPMPKVKLPAGFDVSLRTMFRGQPCQYRYGKIEDESYPISKENRYDLSAALEWISNAERKNITWVSIGKNETMFVFPSKISDALPALAAQYQAVNDTRQGEALFEARAKDFSEYLFKTKMRDPENVPEWIQFFVLKKLDRACSKVMFSYNATPAEVVQRSENWQLAAQNLPLFRFGRLRTPFPLRVARTLNDVWKQDGSLAGDKGMAVSSYYGMQLFFCQPKAVVNQNLRTLVQNVNPLAVFSGSRLNRSQPLPLTVLPKLAETLSLMGMLLFWTGHRKEDYMKEFPYLLGQLLKAADCLHELYCDNVRDKQFPPQLVGGSLYNAAADFPMQTLAQLGQRINPYLNWANAHKNAKITSTEKASPSAGYYLNVFRQIADQLAGGLKEQARFSDAEKAQLFIGYLASFPKWKRDGQNEEENETAEGG